MVWQIQFFLFCCTFFIHIHHNTQWPPIFTRSNKLSTFIVYRHNIIWALICRVWTPRRIKILCAMRNNMTFTYQTKHRTRYTHVLYSHEIIRRRVPHITVHTHHNIIHAWDCMVKRTKSFPKWLVRISFSSHRHDTAVDRAISNNTNSYYVKITTFPFRLFSVRAAHYQSPIITPPHCIINNNILAYLAPYCTAAIILSL